MLELQKWQRGDSPLVHQSPHHAEERGRGTGKKEGKGKGEGKKRKGRGREKGGGKEEEREGLKRRGERRGERTKGGGKYTCSNRGRKRNRDTCHN